MDIIQLQQTLRTFAADRDWEQFHTPKNLSMALMVEAAELVELFQWQTPQESLATRLNPALQMRVGEELADVVLYLLQLADHTGVDLDLAVADKLSKNARKYPKPGEKVTPVPDIQITAQTHVLVDWENVQPKDSEIRRLVPDVTHVWIFHGPNQLRVEENQTSFGNALTLVPISRAGKNSLDFHLSYYVGYISSRNPNARFVVISNDQGYAPMLEHAKVLGFAASQIGFAKSRAATKRVSAKKTPDKKAGPENKPDKPSPKTTPQTPKKVSRSTATKKAALEAPTLPAKSATRKPIVAKASIAPAVAEKNAPIAPKTRKTGSAPTASASVAKKRAAVQTIATAPIDERAYAHVLASLQKSRNKPTRKARLYGAVKSLLGKEEASDATVERIVQRLTAEGRLTIDANGAVIKTP